MAHKIGTKKANKSNPKRGIRAATNKKTRGKKK